MQQEQVELTLTPQVVHRRNSSLERVVWESCCFRLDRALAFFFAQFFITLAIICFCIYQLVQASITYEARQYYSGTLTFLMGVWMPSPRPPK